MRTTKFPISWHENCLTNLNSTLDRKQQELNRLIFDVNRLQGDVLFYRRQIEEAKKRGLTEFDPERFLVKRNTAEAK